MEEKKTVDFKKYTSPSGSKMYLLKVLFYVIVLAGLIYYMKSQTVLENEIQSNTSIENLSIDTTTLN